MRTVAHTYRQIVDTDIDLHTYIQPYIHAPTRTALHTLDLIIIVKGWGVWVGDALSLSVDVGMGLGILVWRGKARVRIAQSLLVEVRMGFGGWGMRSEKNGVCTTRSGLLRPCEMLVRQA